MASWGFHLEYATDFLKRHLNQPGHANEMEAPDD